MEVNIKMLITMHFYTVELQNNVFHKDQLKLSYVFLIYTIDSLKTIHGKYKQMLLANDTDSY